jgi:hypothetical protein
VGKLQKQKEMHVRNTLFATLSERQNEFAQCQKTMNRQQSKLNDLLRSQDKMKE